MSCAAVNAKFIQWKVKGETDVEQSLNFRLPSQVLGAELVMCRTQRGHLVPRHSLQLWIGTEGDDVGESTVRQGVDDKMLLH